MRRSELALRTVCFLLVSFLSLCWLLQPGFAQAPWPQGLSHKAIPGINRFPYSASSRPPRSTPSTSLPPSGPHSRASTGGGVFLGATWMHLHLSPQALGPATDPPQRSAPGSRLPARSRACSARAGRPERCSPGVAYKGSLLWPRARKASVAQFFPHPHEILGLVPRCRRPWFSERVGQSPRTRAKVSLNALGEWAKGELGH